uniref:ribosomal protein L28 n=1 Tax=Goniotrichopsis reniformis TaxID=468933 RepID=UPI001FCD5853|nr:ribosomal protein L28 [Goniotrichopsis reniformis]UNJ14706.1 ribosomal protein L28 [Goniotrichopsis reniformis]
MGKQCQITGKVFNNAYAVSHSHVRTKKRQHINLQKKKIWSFSKNRWITLTLSTKALKSLNQMKINI